MLWLKIAELNVSLITGGTVIEYMKVKNRKQFGKRMKKMLQNGELDFGAVLVDMAAVERIAVKWHEVH